MITFQNHERGIAMPEDKSKKRGIIFLALVLILATGYYFFVSQGTPVFRFSAEKRTFAFTGSKNTSAVFLFDTLEALEFYEGTEQNYGEPAGGGTVWGGYNYGTWKNDSLGTYEAFVSTRMNAYIIARDAEKTAIFNTTNTETTRSLYEQLLQFWKENP